MISELVQKALKLGYSIKIESLSYRTTLVKLTKGNQSFGEVLQKGFNDEEIENALKSAMRGIEEVE